jgi:hypothetical protein
VHWEYFFSSLLGGFLLLVSAMGPDAPQGGARIDVPFKRQIAGAQCYAGTGAYAGAVAFGFPARGPNQALAFSIGPLKNSPGQEKNKPYSGPGTYNNIGFMAKSESGNTIFGYGTVVVSSDQQKGTFSFKSNLGNASGSWNCGHPLKH